MNPNQNQNQLQLQLQAQAQLQQLQREPKKCPRCDSLSTKFCYFNNYSLAQPRYFCKACRRYWTLGGNIRNIPVGGCRKKRAKVELRAIQPQPQAQPQPQPQPQPQSNQMLPYFPGGGGFLTIEPMQMAPGFNQPLNMGGDPGGPSNLAMFPEYMAAVPPYGLQQQPAPLTPQAQFYMGNKEKAPVYPAEPKPDLGPQQQNWAQDFMNNEKPSTPAENSGPFWNWNLNPMGKQFPPPQN